MSPDQPEAASGMTLLSLGEDADRVSIRDYQRLDSGDDLVLPRGYGRLLERYAEGLEIALATPVSAVDFSGAGVQIETPRGTVRARAVVITVSVNVLKSGAIRFTPGLPAETRRALDGIGMGALTKLALKFEGTKFGQSPWTQFFDTGNRGDLVNFEFWPWGNDLVVAHFGGDYARGVAASGDAAAVDHMLTRLVAILGEDARKAFRAVASRAGARIRMRWAAIPSPCPPGGCARRACKARGEPPVVCRRGFRWFRLHDRRWCGPRRRARDRDDPQGDLTPRSCRFRANLGLVCCERSRANGRSRSTETGAKPRILVFDSGLGGLTVSARSAR